MDVDVVMRGKGVGRSREEARKRAEESLKERLWKEVWKEEIALPVKGEEVVEIGGMFEVEIEV